MLEVLAIGAVAHDFQSPVGMLRFHHAPYPQQPVDTLVGLAEAADKQDFLSFGGCRRLRESLGVKRVVHDLDFGVVAGGFGYFAHFGSVAVA